MPPPLPHFAATFAEAFSSIFDFFAAAAIRPASGFRSPPVFSVIASRHSRLFPRRADTAATSGWPSYANRRFLRRFDRLPPRLTRAAGLPPRYFRHNIAGIIAAAAAASILARAMPRHAEHLSSTLLAIFAAAV
jgi:hypothetical protein